MGVTSVEQITSWKMPEKEKPCFDAAQCPYCKKGKMKELLSFDDNGPPDWLIRKVQLQKNDKQASL